MALCIGCGKEEAMGDGRMLGRKCYLRGKLEEEIIRQKEIAANKERAARDNLLDSSIRPLRRRPKPS